MDTMPYPPIIPVISPHILISYIYFEHFSHVEY